MALSPLEGMFYIGGAWRALSRTEWAHIRRTSGGSYAGGVVEKSERGFL